MPGKSTSSVKKKKEAVRLLGAGVRQGEVAKAIGVEKSTVSKWLQINPEFSKQVDAKREVELSNIRETYLQIIKDSVESIKTVAGDPNHKSFAKIQEVLARSVGLLDKLPDFSNAYRYHSHTNKERAVELYEEMGKLWDNMSQDERTWVETKCKAFQTKGFA